MKLSTFYGTLSNSDRTLLDLASIGTVVATLADILPSVAALLTILWTGIRVYETKTVQKLLGKYDGKSPDSE